MLLLATIFMLETDDPPRQGLDKNHLVVNRLVEIWDEVRLCINKGKINRRTTADSLS